jgi:GT2 family glycosyltransferase
MNASIIIPVYKRTAWIKSCIEKLQKQGPIGRFEIIIVDDGSPNSREFQEIISGITQTNDCLLRYYQKEHSGPAASRNYGVKLSTGPLLCFLDDDSLPHEDWLKEITEPFSRDVSIGLVSGKTLSLDRSAGLSLLLEENVYPEKSWASCNIAYRRSVFEELGGFDEQFKEPSWEDNDLGLRTRWRGYDHVYNAKAIVHHPHEKSFSEYRKKCLLNGRGAAAFSKKYLLKKPLWAIAAPFLMSRRLFYGIFPSVWLREEFSPFYVKYLWSFYSLQGFLGDIFKIKYE